MKILIATGIYPPAIGGPAQYAKELASAFEQLHHKVEVRTFRLENFLPTGIRHIFYFFKILPAVLRADFIIALDTFSVAWPTVFAAKLFSKKVIIRTGGDFLWEQYVERTGEKVLLKDFYQTSFLSLSFKERIIYYITKSVLHHASVIVFSTSWQRDIFSKPYEINLSKTFIVENFYGQKTIYKDFSEKVFLGSTRKLKWKNLDLLEEAFSLAKDKKLEIKLDLENRQYESFLDAMSRAYVVILVSLGDISPNMILDAIKYGKPFICTRECGLYEKLKDIGIWVDPKDVSDISEKILWLADEHNYATQKKKIEEFTFTHSWEEIAKEMIDIAKR